MQSPTKTPSNLRTLLILEVLGKSDRPMTATEINAVLNLPKQTVHRLCATLEEFGFITRLSNSKKYQVARRCAKLVRGCFIIHAITSCGGKFYWMLRKRLGKL